MTKLRTVLLVTLAATSVAGSFSTAANARGLLAGFAKDIGLINEDQRRALDDAHARMGRPLDHMANQGAGAVANIAVPGSGVYVTRGLELRDQYNRGEFGR